MNNTQEQNHEVYQYTKGIRFKAESQGEINNPHLKYQKGKPADIASLAQSSQQFVDDLKNFIFYTDKKTGEQKLVSKIDINKSWLKSFCHQNFYEKIRHSKKGKGSGYSISDISFLKEKLDEWIEVWSKTIETLQDLNDESEHSQNRRSDMALQIQKLNSNEMLNFMSLFLQSINNKENGRPLKQLIKNFEGH